ncbi:hypothetical protein OHA77_19365 [Streptosporangium sp. NBC_01639]|uniref:hypothetical protein n=1 Tax=Streptosporangium sp. NBC_01639 TaxID=2975948 RepID=UPI00386FB39D|nr:hypothetical protein OHA77_19365 [Streptosporangium sp. NBC_01639]
MRLELLTGEQTLVRRSELVSVYREAFTGPPWHEDEDAVVAFHDRLTADAGRPAGRRRSRSSMSQEVGLSRLRVCSHRRPQRSTPWTRD